MSGSAIVFMFLTMGFVVALNVICIVAWLKAKPAPPHDAPAPAADDPK